MFDSFHLSLLIWTFTIYSFCGWLVEVIYYSYTRKEIHNRGFLYGPFCPIYGVSLISIVWLLSPFQKNIILFFVGAVIISSAIEYFTAVVLELLFKTQWWDYSQDKFNLDGKICLQFSLYWGILATIVVKFIHPLVFRLAETLTIKLTGFGASLVMAYFFLDFIITVISMYGLKKFFETFNNLKRQYDLDVVNIQKSHLFPFVRLRRLQKKFNQNQTHLFQHFKKHYIRLIKAFPELKSTRYSIINEIRRQIKSRL